MKNFKKRFLALSLVLMMMMHSSPVFASSENNMTRGTYMSSATVYATVSDGDDVIGNAVVTCLSKVKEINVDMYLQRAYGNTWQNVTSAYNMTEYDLYELDRSAIIYNVSPGTYRVYIEVAVTGYDGLFDSAAVGTGSFTIAT